MQKMPPAIFTGTVFGLLQSFGLIEFNVQRTWDRPPTYDSKHRLSGVKYTQYRPHDKVNREQHNLGEFR